MTTHARGAEPPSALRTGALIATAVAVAGSLGFLLHAPRHPPRPLLLLFVVWSIAPFVALLLAHRRRARWTDVVRRALYITMLCVSVFSLAGYGYNAWRPPAAKAAFMFVMVPLISWALIAIAGLAAAIIARSSSRNRGAAAH